MKTPVASLPHVLSVILLAAALLAPGTSTGSSTGSKHDDAPGDALDDKDVRGFLAAAGRQLREMSEETARGSWVAANFITEDTAFLKARQDARATLLTVQLATQAAMFDGLNVSTIERRQLNILKQAITLPAPNDKALANELATLAAGLEARYGKGQYCQPGKECLDLVAMGRLMAESRDARELKDIWRGWREVAPPMRADYTRLVAIANQGARELGYPDLGSMWRAGYDMEADAFAADMDAQWHRVKPLYDALHCHVRDRLSAFYGADTVAPGEKIPAHLLGNMWAQQWGNIYDLVAPENSTGSSVDITRLLVEQDLSERDMVRTAENFFVSLGLDPLPATFWERSLFTQPRDRDVVCHASAWNLDNKDDLRIKMCIQRTAEDFSVIHHELGHNYYQRAYNHQPLLLQGGANDGFHEALGDTIALSITPDYLVKIGLLQQAPAADNQVAELLKIALNKVAFLPFGLLVDKWRWQVFSGELQPEDYNTGWWALREHYQGIASPVERTADHFDPGAKYHIPGNTPYMRYFLGQLQQFQFHQALCAAADYEGPLHRCTIYGSRRAGKRLQAMMTLGASRPWQEAMQVLTGQDELDASALLAYFAPLQTWLDEQNQGRQCGW